MTDAELNEIEARLRAATPGPWYVPGAWPTTDRWRPVMSRPKRIAVIGSIIDYDATFIAHAPEDIAALLAEVHKHRQPEG